jgi:serine/threonine protein kinase
MAQARTATRRGPRWPRRFFWLPVLVVALAAGSMPAGSTGQLWIGVALGSFLGMLLVPLVGAPARVPQAAPAARKRAALPAGKPSARPAQTRKPKALPSLAGTPGPLPVPRQTRREYPATRHASGSEPRFRLVRRLGSGGFGRVWLAADARRGTLVALKAAHVPDAETEQRIRREARALGTVRHPNCVRIHDLLDASSDPGLATLSGLVIVMDFVDGQSLGEIVLQRGILDDRAAARIWAGVSGALAAAHDRGVLHRDVKPGNVIVDRAGLPHLIDFGIARSRGDATLTAHGFVLGTPDFLAPEVARGQPASPSSDAWQLAATVSFALTGYPPRGGHPDALSGLRAAAAGMPPSHLPTRSAHYKLLCAAMAADPRQRPSLAGVRSSLEGWLRRAGEPVDGPVAALSGSAG